MGYTHYFRRKKIIDKGRFEALVQDAKILIEAVKEYGVLLAGSDGTGEPIVNSSQIALNGREKCGHPVNKNIIILGLPTMPVESPSPVRMRSPASGSVVHCFPQEPAMATARMSLLSAAPSQT